MRWRHCRSGCRRWTLPSQGWAAAPTRREQLVSRSVYLCLIWLLCTLGMTACGRDLTNQAMLAGNVATEDLVYLLSGLGIEHGVDMDRLLDASHFISQALGRQPHSRVARAMLAKRGDQAVAVAA